MFWRIGKIKIGLISTTIYPLSYPFRGYGGIEPLVANLAVELKKRGHEVVVFAPKGSSLPEGIEVVETVEPTIQYQYEHEEQACKKVVEWLKKNKIDILHDNTHQKYIYLYKMKHPKLKLCSTLHNQCNFQNPPPGVRYMNLIGISDHHCREASSILGIHLERVYNGIDLNKYIYNEDKEDYFLFLSRISRFKGAHEAIEAAKQLRVSLKVAGEDVFVQDPSYVMRIMQSCTGNIKYLGNIAEEKKIDLLSKAKALVLPLQWNEPFGLVAIEALASGTPVITTPMGAMPEIVSHRKDGFLCSNFEEIKLAMKLVDEIDPQDCKKKAEQFTIQKMAENYERLYEKILRGEEW